MQPVMSNGCVEVLFGVGELKNADITSDDQLQKQASGQTVKDDMWIDQPPLKGLHWLKLVCNSIAQMCECQKEQSLCACTFICVCAFMILLIPRVGLELVRDISPPFLSPFGSKCKPPCQYIPRGWVIRCWPLVFLILPVFLQSVGVPLGLQYSIGLLFFFPSIT